MFSIEEYFYHKSIKRYIALFGSVFINLNIKRVDGDKETFIKVPIKYGVGNRYMKADQGESRESTKYSRVVPAMMFELKTFYKDVSRKTNAINRISSQMFDAEGRKKFTYNRVPYNFIFELNILTKNADDMFQIAEQILPAFDPNLTVKIEDIGQDLDVEQDIVINLQEINIEDNYDEDSKRMVDYKITFELKGYLYKIVKEGYVVKEVDLLAFYGDIDSDPQSFIVLDTITEQDPIQEEQYINSQQHNDIENLLFQSVENV